MSETEDHENGLADEPRGGNMSAWLKLLALAVLVAAIVVAFKFTNLGYYFQREFIEGLLDRLGYWAPLGFIAIYAVATVLGVPGTIMTVLGGVVFGAYWGTVLVVIGATIGACGAFSVARFLARDFITEMFGKTKWFRRLDEGVREYGLSFILFIRLVPIFPFNGINFATGLTMVRFRDYFIGTLIGIIPASFVFTNAAAQAAQAAAGKKIGADFYISLVLLALIAVIPAAYKKYKMTRESRRGE